MEGNVVFRHRQPIEMLETFSKLVSVSFPGKEAYGLFVVYPIRRRKVQLDLESLLQRLLEAQTIGVHPISVFLREHKSEGNESLEFPRQPYPLRKAKHGKKGVIGPSLFGQSFEEHGFEGLFEETAHCMMVVVLRL